MAGDKNVSRFGRLGSEMSQQFHARHVIHPDVEDGNFNRIIRHELKEEFGLAKGQDFEAIGLKQATN